MVVPVLRLHQLSGFLSDHPHHAGRHGKAPSGARCRGAAACRVRVGGREARHAGAARQVCALLRSRVPRRDRGGPAGHRGSGEKARGGGFRPRRSPTAATPSIIPARSSWSTPPVSSPPCSWDRSPRARCNGFPAHRGRRRMSGGGSRGPAAVGGGLRARSFVWMQYLLPQHGLSRSFSRHPRALALVQELADPGISETVRGRDGRGGREPTSSYATFNEFFTRPLRAECPPDRPGIDRHRLPRRRPGERMRRDRGRFAAAGQGPALRARGNCWRTSPGRHDSPAARSRRSISLPSITTASTCRVDGRLLDTVYVPGRLFSVNDATAQRVPRLFARNERVLTLFEGGFGAVRSGAGGCPQCGQHRHRVGGRHHPGGAARRDPHSLARDRPCERSRARALQHGIDRDLLFEPGRAAWRPALRAGAIRAGRANPGRASRERRAGPPRRAPTRAACCDCDRRAAHTSPRTRGSSPRAACSKSRRRS